MTPRVVYRLLIVTTWMLPLLSQIGSAGYHHRSDEHIVARPALDCVLHPHDPQCHIVWWIGLFVLGGFAVSIILSIGMWFFYRWARIAYIPFCAFYVWLVPFGMPPPYLPIDVADLATFLTYAAQGAVSAMAFLSPVTLLFEHEVPNQAMQPTAPRSDA